jgi:spermidine synthase
MALVSLMSRPASDREYPHPPNAEPRSAHAGLHPVSLLVLLAVFFLSGAAGLVYQVVWMRALALVFGVTTYAVATVLATFMGGLAIGSYAIGRRIDRVGEPLLVYAALEAAIGVYALFVPALLAELRGPYVLLRHAGVPYVVLALGRALLAGLVLLPPTVAMGGTFPAVTRFLVRRRGSVGRSTALLYFANTAGAIAGCLLAGFFLLERFGLRGAAEIAAATNVAVAAATVLLARATRSVPASPASAAAARAPAVALPRAVHLALACAAASGFASLGYEVLWTRALPRYLYNSTYAFTIMLATFLAGIALGSALYAARLDRARRPLRVFAVLELLAGLTFVLSGILFADLLGVSEKLLGGNAVASFADSLRGMFVRAGLVLLVPATFLGATFPVAARICAGVERGVGAAIGRLYGVNTCGAILGSLATGFILIPVLGMRGTLVLLIAINLLCAVVLLLADATAQWQRLGMVAAVALAFGGVLYLLPPDLFRRSFAHGLPLVFYDEGATDTVGVGEVGPSRIIFYDDQRGTAGTHSFAPNFLLGHLPMLLHPGVPRRILHVCFGVGNSLSAVAAHESVERVDSVELSPHVLDAAEFFWTNAHVIRNPRVHSIIDDGRNFLMSTRETYDVIVLEPPETFTAGVINLYTREFYADAAARLAPDGVLLQWVPVGEASIEEERMLFRAFLDAFPNATAWHQFDSGALLFVGFKGPVTIDYQRLQARMREPRVARDLELIGIRNVDHLLAYFTLDPAAFAAVAGDAPPIVDDRTVLDFSAPRQLGSGFGLGQYGGRLANLVAVDGRSPLAVAGDRSRYYRRLRVPVAPYLANLNGEDPAAVQARIDAESRVRATMGGTYVQAEWRRWPEDGSAAPPENSVRGGDGGS